MWKKANEKILACPAFCTTDSAIEFQAASYVANALTCMSYFKAEDETFPKDYWTDSEEEVVQEQEGKIKLDRAPNWKMRLFNGLVGLFQFVTGVILLGITDPDKTWAWYSSFPGSVGDRSDPNFGVPEPKLQADVPVGYFSGIFLILSAVDHLIIIIPGVWGVYKYWIKRRQNHFRWIEYSVSASLMHVMIAQLSGVTDVHLLYCIAGLTASTMLFGAAHEKMNWKYFGTPAPRCWMPFLCGFIPHMFVWTVIACYFFRGVSQADPPGFVWAIIFVLSFFDLLFAVMLYVQWLEIWIFKKNYILGEIGFIILSLTAKQLLAWINYGGSQR